MNTYYHTLGLKPGASQDEIKKAYFKQVRQHSPESDPQQFQKIREAYEQLKKQQHRQELPVFPALTDPAAVEMMQQIQALRKEKNMILYRDTCEAAWHRFPGSLQFLYMLVMAQRKCQNTGKAVKNAELLASRDPQNKWFQKELAISYMERGFKNKSLSAFEKARGLGCRDTEFLLMYAGVCKDNFCYEKGVEVLLEIIRKDTRWTRDDIHQLDSAYTMVFCMLYSDRKKYLAEILQCLQQHLARYSIYMKESAPALLSAAARMCTDLERNSKECTLFLQLLAFAEKIYHSDSERQLIKAAADSYYYQRIEESAQIGETIKRYLEIFHVLKDTDASYRKFVITDAELCMIEEREDTLKQAEIIKLESPPDYEKIAPFIQKLAQPETLPVLKDSLLKTYQDLEPLFPGGYYYHAYPQEKKKASGTPASENPKAGPYTIHPKNPGRNDPCPCGSGKKYKHCCMKNQTPQSGGFHFYVQKDSP